MRKLEGRVAVVTGGYGGIGAAACEAFGAEGAKVCINIHSDRRLAQANELVKKVEAAGGEAFVYQADITAPEEVRGMFKAVVEKYGKLDILVNNAGILVQGRLQDNSYEEIEHMLKVDLFATFVCIKEAYPYLVKSPYGRIINVTSQLGQKGGPEVSVYSAAKAGVIGLTKALALEYCALGEKNNILVNAIAPGPIDGGVSDGVSKEWYDAKAKSLPLGRYGRAEECAPGFVFLASDDCVLFYGQTLGATCGDTMV